MYVTQFTHSGKVVTLHHYDPEREHISRHISEKKEFYEGSTLQYLAANIEPGGTWVDAGACIGTHTVFFALFCADRVISIEPAAANFSMLSRNIKANEREFRATVQAWNCGISKDARMLWYTVPDNNAGAVQMKGANIVGSRKPENTIFNPIRFLKIDCEEMTGEVLEAFLPIIEKDKPYILIEANDIPPSLRELGYKEVKNWRQGTKTYLLQYEN